MHSLQSKQSLDTGTCPVAVMEVVHTLVCQELETKLNFRRLPA